MQTTVEHELDYVKPNFYEEVNALLKSGSIIKIFNWNRAKDQASLLELIKAHQYRIEAYTFMNFAKLLPSVSSSIKKCVE